VLRPSPSTAPVHEPTFTIVESKTPQGPAGTAVNVKP
jgi:hypothetical protein